LVRETRRASRVAVLIRDETDVSYHLTGALRSVEMLLLCVVDEASSVQLLMSYHYASHVLTVRKPGVDIMTDFDINFTS